VVAVMPWEHTGSKIAARHRERLAVVYVRQSTRQQVVGHQGSTRLRYALVDRAVALGWEACRVVLIDDDLGKSGSGAEHRVGFQRLVAEISLGHVGLVLGTEMSRLARSGKGWYQLLELCAVRAGRVAAGGCRRRGRPDRVRRPAAAGVEGDDVRCDARAHVASELAD
jgi:hypothetical protein